jgi:ABC-2 type transport system permease protein
MPNRLLGGVAKGLARCAATSCLDLSSSLMEDCSFSASAKRRLTALSGNSSHSHLVRPLLAQLRIELILTLRRGESLLITLVVPVVLLIFFGTVAATPPEFLVPGLLALAIVSTSMVSLGIATAYERYYGALKRLLGSPLPRSSLVAAKALSVLVVEIVQVALLVILAWVMFGWRPAGSALAVAGAALLLGSAAFAGIGLLMAGTLRAEATLAVANGLYLVFLLLGGFVLPLDRLPEPIRLIAHALPAAALTDATRGALTGDQGVLGSLALLAGWAVLALGGAVATFRPD